METATDLNKCLKKIDNLLNRLKECAFNRTLPNGIEMPCNPIHFSNYVKQIFDEIRKLPQKYFNFNEEYDIYHCEREAIEDIAKEICVKNGDPEKIVQYYLNNIESIVNSLHAKIENDHGLEQKEI